LQKSKGPIGRVAVWQDRKQQKDWKSDEVSSPDPSCESWTVKDGDEECYTRRLFLYSLIWGLGAWREAVRQLSFEAPERVCAQAFISSGSAHAITHECHPATGS
jgi:hypothetical protein